MSQKKKVGLVSAQYFADVERLIMVGELKQAAFKLNEVARIAQADPRLHMVGMQLAEAAGNPKAAVESAQRAVARAPAWPPSVVNLALLYGRLNQFPEALAEAERAVALAPADVSVLRAVIQVAQRAGDMVRSVRWLDALLALAPSDADARLRLAVALSTTGEHARALMMLDEMIDASPGEVSLRESRALARERAGDAPGALADWDALLAQDPANATWRYRRAVTAGEPPAVPPVDMVASLFDNLASIYDMHMLRGLRYRLPKDVADRILELHPDRKFNLLDLGCGTGLLGLMLQRIDGAMVGVDASPKMLEKAAAHGLYDKFHQVDLLDALSATPDALYQVITALDVFIYIGDLSSALPNVFRILTPGGRFFFSCEALSDDAGTAWALQPTGRYAHSRAQVESLCAAAGFQPLVVQELTLRHEGRETVAGFLVEAMRPQVKIDADTSPTIKARKPRGARKTKAAAANDTLPASAS